MGFIRNVPRDFTQNSHLHGVFVIPTPFTPAWGGRAPPRPDPPSHTPTESPQRRTRQPSRSPGGLRIARGPEGRKGTHFIQPMLRGLRGEGGHTLNRTVLQVQRGRRTPATLCTAQRQAHNKHLKGSQGFAVAPPRANANTPPLCRSLIILVVVLPLDSP